MKNESPGIPAEQQNFLVRNLNLLDRLLVACLRTTLPVNEVPAAVRKASAAVCDWDGFVEHAGAQGVIGWTHEVLGALEPGLIPAEVMAGLRSARLAHTARAVAMNSEAATVLKALAAADIRFAVLKGPYLSEHVYQRSDLRYYADLDLLVREEDTGVTGEVLRGLDYRLAEEEKSDSIFDQGKTQVHYLRPGCLPIDLHWDVINLPTHMSSFSVDMEDIWSRTVAADILGVKASVLSPEDLLLFQCTHMTAHHDFNRLLWFKDVEQVINRFGERMDWQGFVSRVTRYRLRTFVYYALFITREIFGKTEIPGTVLEDTRPGYLTARLFERLLKKTNILELQEGRRGPALEVWRVMRDDRGERVSAIASRAFPRVEWYLECYPFLPKIRHRKIYYGLYPLLVAVRIAKRPVNRLERQH